MNIQEIAKLAGVSITTVSKVMNGKAGDISEATREKVLKVVDENDYIPYAKYRKKEGLKSNLLGLIVRKENESSRELISVVEETVKKRGYQLLVSMVENDAEALDAAVGQMQKRNISGLLIESVQSVFCQNEFYKTVYLADTHRFDEGQKNTFYYRKSEAGRRIAKLLLEAGHRTVGCLVTGNAGSLISGVEAVYRELNLPAQLLTTYVGENLEDIQKNGIITCIAGDVTAVICEDVTIAGCVIAYAQQSGIKIPEELSVVCAQDAQILEYMSGGITAVRYPLAKMAEDAAEHLMDMIEQDRDSEIIRKYMPELVARKSVRERNPENSSVQMVIVGSMNMDNLIEGEQIPMNGKTQIAKNIIYSAGGKGGNEAVGVARLGGCAYLIGRLGKDVEGRNLYRSLKNFGVNLDGVEFDESAASGKAFIHIDQNGENTIVVYRGANENLDGNQLNRYKKFFCQSEYCLLSSEIPKETIAAAIQCCRETETKVILKPSAIEGLEEKILNGVDYLIPNEMELEQLVGEKISLEEKAEKLLNCGVKNVIVTLGKRGAYLKNKDYALYFSSAPFQAVDTTGGADSFISALAVALSEGHDLIYSVIFATYAAGITVTRYGAQEALPDKNTIGIYREKIADLYEKTIKGINKTDEQQKDI